MEARPDFHQSELFVNRSSLENHLQCIICSNIQKNPVQCTEGHGYCRSCIVTWKESNQENSSVCPTCKVPLDTLVPNRAGESILLESLVYCYTRLPSLTGDNENEEDDGNSTITCSSIGADGKRKMLVGGTGKGCRKKTKASHCTWEGMLKDAADHFNECPFVGVKCGFDGCDQIVVRSEMAEHRVGCVHRTAMCKWDGCLRHFKVTGMEQHQLVCPRRAVKCPNAAAGCSRIIPFEDLVRHRATCQYEVCACPFADVGCEARMLRNEIDKHEDDECKKHNRLLLKNAQEQRQVIASLKDQLLPILSEGESIVFRVKHDVLIGKEPIVPRYMKFPTRLYSEDFEVRGYKAALYVETAHSTNYGAYLQLSGGPFPCKMVNTFEVVHHDGKAVSAKKNTSTETYIRIQQPMGTYMLISKAAIAAPDNPYVKDGYVTFKGTFKFV